MSDKEEYTYLLHTGSGAIARYNRIHEVQIQELLNGKCSKREQEAHEILKNEGFIVSEDKDEVLAIRDSFSRRFLQNKPLELILLVTEQCNFRCIYCYENFEKGEMTEKTAVSIVEFVKKQLINFRGLQVGWFGGEPLLALPVIEYISTELIRICREMKKPYSASITTNAYFLTYEIFKKLRKLKVHHFQVTIDGPTTIHDKQRVLANGKPTFSIIINNLKRIKNTDHSKIWSVSLRTNITKSVINEREEYLREVVLPFADDDRFFFMLRRMWTNGTDEANRLVCNKKEYEAFCTSLDLPDHALLQDYMFSYNFNSACYAALSNSFVIGSDGEIYKCTLDLYDERNHLGHITENGEAVIDQEKLNKWITPKWCNDPSCYSCHEIGACGGLGCPLRQETPCNRGFLDSISWCLPSFYRICKKSIDLDVYFNN